MSSADHHLIFDFDGVLGDTWNNLVTIHSERNPSVDVTEVVGNSKNYFLGKPVHGRNHTQTPEQMQKRYDGTLAFGKRMYELGVALFDDFIGEIRKIDNALLAVVSSGSEVYVKPAMGRSGLQTTHILAYEDHHSKEEKVELICKDWGISVSEAYYFTDALTDVYELQSLLSKEKLIGVSWGYCTADELAKELDEQYILKKPEDIHRIVGHA